MSGKQDALLGRLRESDSLRTFSDESLFPYPGKPGEVVSTPEGDIYIFDGDLDEYKKLATADTIYSGLVTAPTFTDNGDGTATFGSCEVNLFSTDDFNSTVKKYTVAGATLTFIAGSEEYVCVSYNNGNPILYKETNKANINCSNVILARTVWRINNLDSSITLHSVDTDTGGLGLPMKNNKATWETQPYRRSVDGGLVIAETAIPTARTITCSGADVYTASYLQVVLDYNSSTDILTHAYHVGGVWTYDTSPSVYNNIYTDNGTALVAASGGKWIVKWFYRSIGDTKDVMYVNGTTEHASQAKADEEGLRADLPDIILRHCVLIGKAVIQQGATNGFTESLFDSSIIGVPTINHNDTQNKQGGQPDEYYHLTYADYNNVLNGFLKLDQTTPQTTIGKFTFPLVDVGNTSAGGFLNVYGTEGGGASVNFTASNWTLATGWEATNDGGTRLNHNAAGAGVASYNVLPAVVGKIYKVSFTMEASVAGGCSVYYGTSNVSDIVNPAINTPTTYSFYCVGFSASAALVVVPVTTARFVITDISYVIVTAGTGDIDAKGDIMVAGLIKNPSSTTNAGISISPTGNVRIVGGSFYPNAIIGGGTIASTGTTTANVTTTTIPLDGVVVNESTNATAGVPVRVSPSFTMNSQAWNTTSVVNKVNAMQIYVNPSTGTTTAPTMVFANKTVDGVANATALMGLKSNGDFGIGTITPSARLHIKSGAGITLPALSGPTVIESDGTNIINMFSPNTNVCGIMFGDPESQSSGYIRYNHADNSMRIWTNGGEKITTLSNGNTGVGVTSPGAKLDVVQENASFALIVGSDVSATSRTNNTYKFGRIGIPHYINAEEPFTLVCGGSDGSNNTVNIGGGTGVGNAATIIRFWAAANTTTSTIGSAIAEFNINGLSVAGSATFNYVAKTANYTITGVDYAIECTANSFAVTLPTAAGITGRMYNIKNTGTGIITLATTSSETIDGVLTKSILQWTNLKVMSNGANRIIL